jgi:O-antigen ligase
MITLAGALISYGIMQKLGYDVFQWENASSSRRILSTFGNSIFYANFLLFLLPIVLTNFIKQLIKTIKSDKDEIISYFVSFIIIIDVFSFLAFIAYRISRLPRAFSVEWHRHAILILIGIYFAINYLFIVFLKRSYLVVYLLTMTIFGLFSIVFTLSRGAWLGLIPMLIYILYWVIFYLTKNNFIKINFKKAVTIGMLALIVLGILLLLILPEDVKRRVRNIKFSSTTVQVRFTIWKGALNMIKKRPVTGYGTGTFQLNFPKNRPDYYSTKTVSNNTINTHSEYLQTAANTGIIGLFLFLAIGVYFVIANIKYLKNVQNFKNFFFALALGSAIIAVLIHSLWSVSMRFTSTVIYFYIFLGLFNGMIKENSKENEKFRNKINFPIYIIIILGIIVSIYWINTSDKFYKRDYFIRQGMISDELKTRVMSDNSKLMKDIRNAKMNRQNDKNILTLYLKMYKFWFKGKGLGLRERELNVIKEFFKKLGRCDPAKKYDYLILYRDLEKFSMGKIKDPDKQHKFLNDLNLIFNTTFKDKKIEKEKEYFSVLVDWCFYAIEAEASGFNANVDKLLALYRQQKISYSDIKNTNLYYRKFFQNLQKLYSAKTVILYNLGIFVDPYTYDCHYKRASAFFDLEKYNEALSSYKELSQIAPNYTQIHYNMGVVYRKLYKSEKDEIKKRTLLTKSINELEKSKKLNPYFINTRLILGNDYQDAERLKEYHAENEFVYGRVLETLLKKTIYNPKAIVLNKNDIIRDFRIFVTAARGGKIDNGKYRSDITTLLNAIEQNIKNISETDYEGKIKQSTIKNGILILKQLQATLKQLKDKIPNE